MRKSLAMVPLALLLCLQHVYGKVDACLEKAQPPTENVKLWTNVEQYFASLAQDKTSLERAQFTLLRGGLVTLESAKMELIAVVQGRLAENAAGAVVSKEIGLRNVPDILKRIQIYTMVLDQQTYNLVVLEPIFKSLRFQFDFKGTTTLCEIADSTPLSNPSEKEALQSLLKDLKAELDAIYSAEDQLADFVRKK